MRRLFCLSFVVLAAGACNRGPDVPDASVEPAPDASVTPLRASITLPPQAAPAGGPLRVTWDVQGVAPATVQLKLRSPALEDRTTPTLARYYDRGSAPARGPAWWLGPDGAASATVVAHATAASGAFDLVLPEPREGDWAVELYALDAEQRLLAFATATTWVAAGPALKLTLSRNHAAPTALVNASVELRGTGAEPVRLSAFLGLPDGGTLALPSLTREMLPAREGVLAPGVVSLLARPLGGFGEGPYALSVELHALDGGQLARAGGIVEVCTAQGTLSGTALEGTAPLGDGTVTALDAFGVAYTAGVDATGKYSLQVPAGRYLLLARGDGWTAGATTEVGCGGSREVPLPGARNAAASMSGLRHRHEQALEPTPEPKPVVFVSAVYDLKPNSKPFAQYCYDRFKIDLATVTANQLSLLGLDEVMGLLERGRLAESVGMENVDVGEVTDALGTVEATVTLSFARVLKSPQHEEGRDWFFKAAAALGSTQRSLSGGQVRREVLAGGDELVDQMEEMSRTLAVQVGDGLYEGILQGRERPRSPSAHVATERDLYQPGQEVVVTTSVTDSLDGQRMKNYAYSIVVFDDLDRELMSLPVQTDMLGNGTATFNAPMGKQAVFLRARIPRRFDPAKDLENLPVKIRRENAMIASSSGVLRPGERAQVTVDLYRTSGFLPLVPLQGTNGRPDVAQVRLDASRRATFEFVAGSVEGPATVSALLIHESGMLPVLPIPLGFWVRSAYGLTAAVEPSSTLVNGSAAIINGRLTREQVPVADVPVAVVLLQGQGSISPASRTSATGAFAAVYKAPSSGTGTAKLGVTVVEGGEIVTRELTVAYGPGCTDCPVAVEPSNYTSVPRNGRRAFAANQPVDWSVQGPASIGSDGVLRATNAGGVVLVTATSKAQPSRKVTVANVVACTTGELYGMFSGTLTVAAWQPPYASCGTMTATLRSYIEARSEAWLDAKMGCPGSGVGRYDLDFCSWGRDSFVGMCPGDNASLEPSKQHPGLKNRVLSIINGQRDASGGCVRFFEGQGLVTTP